MTPTIIPHPLGTPIEDFINCLKLVYKKEGLHLYYYTNPIGFCEMYAYHAHLQFKNDYLMACEYLHMLDNSLQRTLLNSIEDELGLCSIKTENYYKWVNNQWAFYYYFNEEHYNIRIYFTSIEYDNLNDHKPLGIGYY